jgi:hypothetical protein
MAGLRERPRLVAARVLAVALLVGVGVAIGALAADPSSEVPARAQTELKRAKIVGVQAAGLVDRVSAELDEALERSRSLSRSTSRLRRELRAATRALKRAQGTRRSRAG